MRSQNVTRASVHLQGRSRSRVRALGRCGNRNVRVLSIEVHVNGIFSTLPATTGERRSTRWDAQRGAKPNFASETPPGGGSLRFLESFERVRRAVRRHRAPACLDRLLVFHRRHLDAILREFITHYNQHRPHRSVAQRAPLALEMARLPIIVPMRRDCDARTSSAVLSVRIGSRRALAGWGSRHPQCPRVGGLEHEAARPAPVPQQGPQQSVSPDASSEGGVLKLRYC
jgi:hypothetical protein